MYLTTHVWTSVAVLGQAGGEPMTPSSNFSSIVASPGGAMFSIVAISLLVTLVVVVLALSLAHRASYAKIQAALQVSEMETQLKQEMLERGMSADEICRVLQTPLASSTAGGSQYRPPRPAPASTTC